MGHLAFAGGRIFRRLELISGCRGISQSDEAGDDGGEEVPITNRSLRYRRQTSRNPDACRVPRPSSAWAGLSHLLRSPSTISISNTEAWLLGMTPLGNGGLDWYDKGDSVQTHRGSLLIVLGGD